MNYKSKMVRGSIVLFLMTLVASIFGYAIRMILTRTIPKVEYGYVYSVISLMGLVGIFFDLGLIYAVIRFSAFYKARKNYSKIKEIFLISLISKVVLSIIFLGPIILFSKEIASGFFHYPSPQVIVILSIVFFFSTFYYVFRGLAQGLEHIYAYSIGEALLTGIVLILVIVFKKSAVSVAYAYLVSTVLSSLFYIVYDYATEKRVFDSPSSIHFETIKKVFAFSLPVFFSSIGYTIMTRTDTFMLTYFKGLEQVAYYQVAVPTSQYLWKFAASVAPIISPIVTGMFSRRDKKSWSDSFSFSVLITMLPVVPAMFTMLLYPKIIIRILFGNAYVAGAQALQILSLVAVFYSYIVIISTFIGASGDTKKLSNAVLVAAGANVVLNAILIPPYGIVGASLATLLSYVVEFVILSFYARELALPMSFDTLGKFAVAGAAFSASVYVLKRVLSMNVYAEMVVVISISLVVYALACYALGLISKERILRIRKILSKPRGKNL